MWVVNAKFKILILIFKQLKQTNKQNGYFDKYNRSKYETPEQDEANEESIKKAKK